MKHSAKLKFVVAAVMVCTHHAQAGTYENGLDHMWVDTPKGKFECKKDKSTNYRQVLKLNGKTVFKEIEGPDDIQEGENISSGILDMNLGCPFVIENRNGYVVIMRDTQPPDFGLQGYAVINFNKPTPTLKSLGEGQRPKDEKIPASKRLQWSDTDITLNYFGYTLEHPGGDANSPKPGIHQVRYKFVSEDVERLK
jgi:hypothetical protein